MQIRDLSRIQRYPYLYMTLLSAVLTVPIWLVKYPPLVDYPNHLARGYVLAHLADGNNGLDRFYQSDWGPYPYILPDLLLVALQRVVGIYIAGKVVLSLCIFSLPIVTLLLIRIANPGHDFLALWALPVAYNSCFLMGFVSSQLSVPLCILLLALWLRYLNRPTVAKYTVLVLLATLLYFTHLLGFGVAGLLVVSYIVLARLGLSRAACSILMFGPGVLLYAWSRWRILDISRASFAFDIHSKISDLGTPLRGPYKVVDGVSIAVVLATGMWVLWRTSPTNWSRRWLGLAGVVFAAFCICPGENGSAGYIAMRLPLIGMLIALCAIKRYERRRALVVAALLLFLIRTVAVFIYFEQEGERLNRLSAGINSIPNMATVFPISPRFTGAKYWRRADVHMWAYGVIDRGWLSSAVFHIHGLQPLAIPRGESCPNQLCGPLVDRSPDWSVVQRTYDYVWADDTPEYAVALSRIGDCVYSDGDLQVYRLRIPEGAEPLGLGNR